MKDLKTFGEEIMNSPADASHLDFVVKCEVKEEKDNETFDSVVNFDSVDEVTDKEESIKNEETEIKWENIEEDSSLSSQHLKEAPKIPELATETKGSPIENESFHMPMTVESSSNMIVDERRVETSLFKPKDSSDLDTFKCDLCQFKTKYFLRIVEHVLVHKNQGPLHPCDECDVVLKTKDSWRMHMLSHKDMSEIRWHICDLCSYKTKYKSNLNKHMLVHKDASEIEWYECNVCDYKSKGKRALKNHKLLHRNNTDIYWYKCQICHYKSNQKHLLNKHILVHKDASDVQWYECDMCDYKSKQNNNLQRHKIIHKDVSEIQWYKCDVCNFESKRKDKLKQHMLVHEDGSKIQWYECDICGYKSKQKFALRKHERKHKKSSETFV